MREPFLPGCKDSVNERMNDFPENARRKQAVAGLPQSVAGARRRALTA
ncbi:hypothetical protein [Paenibacillus jilunlii]|nr:hypothetical protein [Paenibacillus jilunlii]